MTTTTVVSGITFDDWTVTEHSEPSYLVDAEFGQDGVTVVDHYDPHDLITSWMREPASSVQAEEDQSHEVKEASEFNKPFEIKEAFEVNDPAEVNKLPECAPNPKKQVTTKRIMIVCAAVLIVVLVIMLVAIVVRASVSRDNDKNSVDTTSIPPTIPPSTSFPSTSSPSTIKPSTISPSTIPPSMIATIDVTIRPTTILPTTFAPTSVSPTTESPTTLSPTTTTPSTLKPSTIKPSTIGPSTIPPTLIATIPVAVEELRDLLLSVSLDSGLALSDDTSPQFAAFDWLASDPNLGGYSDMRKIQRYVLATLYYSTSGTQWSDQGKYLSLEEHECSWGTLTWNDLPVDKAEVSSRSARKNRAYKAVDGDFSTSWESDSGNEEWIYVKLKQSCILHSVTLHWGDAYAEEYRIETSDDGNEWIQKFYQTAGTGGSETIMLDSSSGRYVRMVGMQSVADKYSLVEFTVRGTDGALPEVCDRNSNLVEILLDDNNLRGTLPGDLALLSDSLEVLSLSGNALTGPVPNELGLLTKLREMDISNNDFSGVLPDDICSLELSELLVDCEETTCSCCPMCP